MVKTHELANSSEERAASLEYLQDPNNRRLALSKAVELIGYIDPTFLTTVKAEALNKEEFSRTQVVRCTSLSHKNADRLLSVLANFGYVIFKDLNHNKFVFNLTDDDWFAIQRSIAMESAARFAKAIADYKSYVTQHAGDEAWNREVNEIRDALNKIVFAED